MQKCVDFVVFRGGPCKSQGIQYCHLIFWRGSYLTTPINCAKFERNPWFKHYNPPAWFSHGHTLKWDNLVIRRKKHKAIMMFKSLNEQAPVYWQNLFPERSTDYDLRTSFRKLTLPRPRTNYLKRSFSYSGALLWTSFQKCERNKSGNLKSKSNIYLSHRTLTRLSCNSMSIVVGLICN